mgnify:CR=1 FL=1
MNVENIARIEEDMYKVEQAIRDIGNKEIDGEALGGGIVKAEDVFTSEAEDDEMPW